MKESTSSNYTRFIVMRFWCYGMQSFAHAKFSLTVLFQSKIFRDFTCAFASKIWNDFTCLTYTFLKCKALSTLINFTFCNEHIVREESWIVLWANSPNTFFIYIIGRLMSNSKNFQCADYQLISQHQVRAQL